MRLGPDGPHSACHHVLNLVLFGDPNAGKKSVLLRYCNDSFKHNYYGHSLGPAIEFMCRQAQLDGQLVLLRLWLRWATERDGPFAIRPSSYHGALGILFALDVTNAQSTQRMRMWLREDERHRQSQSPERHPDIARLLLATKVDSPSRVVERTTGEALAAEFGIRYAESSSLTGGGVQEAVEWLAEQASERWKAFRQHELTC